MTFSQQTRQENLFKLANEKFDLLIIGGGITGAGVALQAAASGLKTALVEMQDFAEGTSSRSTKMVHGGIRYLKTFDVGVVADTVNERARIQKIAPHIPRPTRMILPIYDEPHATYDLFSVKVAMHLYDQLAGLTDSNDTSYMLTHDEVIAKIPTLNRENLLGAGCYLDFTNNDARLVIENIKKAATLGATLANRVKIVELLHDDQNQIIGAYAEDTLTEKAFSIDARVVINATGPWVDETNQLDKKIVVAPQLRPTKGVHFVVDWQKLPVPQPLYFDSLHHDQRMIFVIPRLGKTYFGTTDTDYNGDITHPQISNTDLNYLLSTINQRFPKADLSLADIEVGWAGIRPLIASNSSSDYNGGGGHLDDRSIDHVIDAVINYRQGKADRTDVADSVLASEQALSEKIIQPSQVSRGSLLTTKNDGLIVLSGGKITDYRRMATGAIHAVIDQLSSKFDRHFQIVDSTKLKVAGGDLNPDNVAHDLAAIREQGEVLGLSKDDANVITNLFGSNALAIFNNIHSTQAAAGLSLRETLILHYCLAEEMVLTPVDYLLRRTNHVLFDDRHLNEIQDGIVNEMAHILNWSTETKQLMIKDLEKTLFAYELKYLKAGQSMIEPNQY
ncbi:type 1 glycerol-3-phosphate oxidase [Lapidilactobacillus mulanensis]|uniref:Alpha-glycerophosphate oxidase n=1 Tax=Lapidilactobacillus mulanensis TaxID=2485999 RepID=A0ABW4DPP6_9LACO